MSPTRVLRVEPAVGSGDYFIGEVMSRRLLPGERERPGVATVRFAEGARTRPHTHSGEQIIFVVDGELEISTSEETVRAGRSDLIVCPAGIEHTHAAVDGACETFVITWGATEWADARH